MSHTPIELKYASTHEWARLEENGTVTVGITDHAQAALGDVARAPDWTATWPSTVFQAFTIGTAPSSCT